MEDDYMDQSSGGDSDGSDSEVEEYVEESYEQLKSGKRRVKLSEEAFTCPFCPNKKKQDYKYKDLLQHATMVGKSDSKKRNSKDKANHLALVKFLENDIAQTSGPSKPVDEIDRLADHDGDEMFVWPWKGIVVNLPIELKDGRYVGKSGSNMRDQLTARGFNPTRVVPLWNFRGHSGSAIVEFNKGWEGFNNAMSFEKAYEADHHGKRDWKVFKDQTSEIYGWVARADDYEALNIIGEHLRKIGDLRTVSDIMAEEDRKANSLVSNLTSVIEVKKRHFEEMESKFIETESSLSKLIAEKDVLHQSYNEDLKKIQVGAREHFLKIFNDHEKIKLRLVNEKKELELRGQELEKREVYNENERKKVSEEMEQNAARNSLLQRASNEQKKADESVMKLADDQKREKEELHKKIILLEKQLDAKQAVELEIERLRGQLNVMKHMGDDDLEVMKKVEDIHKNLREKEEELDDLESLNQTLVVQERKSNDELQDARKELIDGLKDLSSAHIGVKRMGELENKPFLDAMKRKYGEIDAEDRASEMRSLWEEYLRDPNWHPFEVVTVNGRPKRIIDENDEKLKGLKRDMGEEVYNAVTTALIEINDYNPSGMYITTELWNFTEGRKASLQEGVSYLLKMWDAQRDQKRRRVV
ncbi:protein INVOLVED IN DE NOVO 2-like [Bidens hawaiensis]|uniref:protein INVOLVED IN DE NOVO 2-like n=1 Tax=Bidens hawaiensis TaxID=980011 RepID=UPI00404B66CE